MNSFKTRLKDCLVLFLVFLKIGAFTFGGGYAMISLIENEVVSKRKWLTEDKFFQIIAVSESTPGPIAINMATYVGCRRAGVLGSLAATLGVTVPAFAVMFVVSVFLDRLLEIRIIAAAFKGIKVGVAVLILFAGLKLSLQLKKGIYTVLAWAASFAAGLAISLLALNFSTIYLILIGGAAGFAVFLISERAHAARERAPAGDVPSAGTPETEAPPPDTPDDAQTGPGDGDREGGE